MSNAWTRAGLAASTVASIAGVVVLVALNKHAPDVLGFVAVTGVGGLAGVAVPNEPAPAVRPGTDALSAGAAPSESTP